MSVSIARKYCQQQRNCKDKIIFLDLNVDFRHIFYANIGFIVIFLFDFVFLYIGIFGKIYRYPLTWIQVSFDIDTGLFWQQHRSLLTSIQVSFDINTGLFGYGYRSFDIHTGKHPSNLSYHRAQLHMGTARSYCHRYRSLLTWIQVSFDIHIGLFWHTYRSLLTYPSYLRAQLYMSAARSYCPRITWGPQHKSTETYIRDKQL